MSPLSCVQIDLRLGDHSWRLRKTPGVLERQLGYEQAITPLGGVPQASNEVESLFSFMVKYIRELPILLYFILKGKHAGTIAGTKAAAA